MANVGYDTLTITINADSKQANKSISNLSKNLQNLDKTSKEMDKERINEVKGLLLDISKIDFSNVSKGLQDVVSAFKSIQKVGTKYETIKKSQGSGVLGLGGAVNSLQMNNSGFYGAFDPSKALGEYNSKLAILTQNANKVNISDEFGNAVKPSQEVAENIKKISDNAKKSTSGLSQFAKQFKNILKYRVVRKIIQQIFTEISNAFNELASVDKEFDSALGEIKSDFSYIARTLASVIAPIVKFIAPFITALAQGLGSVISELGSSLSSALGQETFAEATENVETYTESLKKAKNVSLGIDELNVVGQEQSGNFELKKTDETNNKLVETLQNLIKSLQPIFTALQSFIEKLSPLLNFVVDLLSQILNETMDSVNNSIGSVIKVLGTAFEIIGRLLQALSPIISLLATIVDTGLNLFNDIIIVLAELTNELLKPLLPIIELIGELLKLISPALQFLAETFKSLTGQSDNVGARVIGGIATGGLSELFKYLKEHGGFASGGFPQENGLFFANSNELVGKFDNGKTAVANNEQITNGIYRAVLQAMTESGYGNIQVLIDGNDVAKIVERNQKNSGMTMVYGGSINYGK